MMRHLAVPSLIVLALIMPSPYASADDDGPATLELTGVVRDFRERTDAGGHPDFERRPSHGFGLYCGNVGLYLGDDGKPVFTGAGYLVTRQAEDRYRRPIAPHLYKARFTDDGLVADRSLRDRRRVRRGASDAGGIQSAESFASWYRDIPGTNQSKPLKLTLRRTGDGTYVFDDREDAQYASLGGFFPIEDQLFGNPGGSPDRNFHFTYELETQFTYDADADQVFRFTGDDDVWVYIDGKLAIDLGGVHGKTDQYVPLDRMGLEDGGTYSLKFFFAERHRTQSNFRIETNLALESSGPITITQIFD